MRLGLKTILLIATASGAVSCGSDDVSSEEDARLAYMGLHRMVDKVLNLGMDGYNEASNANIPAQEAEGDLAGTITVSGQVDQGTSPNKEMNLDIDLVEYQDEIFAEGDVDAATGIEIVYDTDPEDPPHAELSLRNIPNGTFTGTLTGSYTMAGDLEGVVTLDLDLSGDIEEVEGSEGEIRRVPGSTEVVGTAESRYGVFDVNLEI